jgi:hypothetical protein
LFCGHAEQLAQQCPVPRAEAFHAAFPVRHHVGVDCGASLTLSPGDVVQLVRELLRPPQLRAQLPEPRAPGGCLGGHSEGTPFEVARQPAGLAAVLVWQDYRRGLVAGKETPRKDLLTTISKLSWYGSGSEP